MAIQSVLAAPRGNDDLRITEAYNLFNRYVQGKLLVHKTTRAGFTTACAAESINRGEQFLMIVPTNAIADKTIVKDSVKYSDKKNAHIIHIPSNHKCLLNVELCEQYPNMTQLPVLPLPEKCTECDNYDSCPITEILRHPRCDGIVLTYDKLAAIMMSASLYPKSIGAKIEKIIRNVKNIVFDEVHEIQYGKKSDVKVYDSKADPKHMSFTRYHGIADEYNSLAMVIANFDQLMMDEHIKNGIMALEMEAMEPDYFVKKLSNRFKNNHSDIALGDTEDMSSATMAVYMEMIEMAQGGLPDGVHMGDVLMFYQLLDVIKADFVVLNAIRDKNDVSINVTAIDDLYYLMLKKYLNSVNNDNKRIIFTSATICSHDYCGMFPDGEKMINCMFGKGGDPMRTNSKMTVLCDDGKLWNGGRYAWYKKLDEIIDKMDVILKAEGESNVMIVTHNKKSAFMVTDGLRKRGYKKVKCTWYKSSDTIGVTADARVLIALGMAEKPSNTFDAISDDSKVLLEEANQCDTYQAWGRVKDPQGITPSIVFAFMCRSEDVINVMKWGYERTVDISRLDNKKKVIEAKVGGSHAVTMPDVIECKAFLDMCEIASDRRQNKYLVPDIDKKSLINKEGTFLQFPVQYINDVATLADLFTSRKNAYANQGHNGGYFKVDADVTEKLVKSHISGKATIGTYALNEKSECSWICFDVDAHPKKDATKECIIAEEQRAEDEKDNLCMFLKTVNVPYVLEASGSLHSYHIWILILPVKGSIAKAYGKFLLKNAGIDCELFPKQVTVTRKGYGNLVKMPLATHKKNGNLSKIWDGSEWVRSFEGIDLRRIDISSFVMPEEVKTQRKKIKQYPRQVQSIDGIRPCIQNAIEGQLHGNGEQGHWMRIAIVREFFNFGVRDVVKIAKLFSGQKDYDESKTIKHIESIISNNMPIWRKDTLKEKCGIFIDCDSCEYYECKKY